MGQILITGGAGYLGSHTVRRLAAAGYAPVVLDNLSTGHRELARFGDFVPGDVRDPVILDSVFSSRTIDAVIHFAAATQVDESFRDPLFFYQNILHGTMALLTAMSRHMVDTLVFSSSGAVYGPPFDRPLTEDHPLGPLSPGARGKRMVEEILTDMSRATRLKHISLRCFNAAGADPCAELGERHCPEHHLIPLLLQTALGQRGQVDIHGDDYPTPDGTAIRDYVHVDDVAEAHVLALNHLLRGGDSGPLNIGSGQGHSVRQVLLAARKVTEHPIPIRTGPRREGGPPQLVADASRARALLGWAPRHTDIHDIIATAWAWHKKEAAAAPQL